MSRLAGKETHYTLAILDDKGKPSKVTFEFPSVTHILDVVAKPALYRWYYTEGIRGAGELIRQYGDKTPTDMKSLLSLMNKHQLGPYAVRDAKADLGKIIHGQLEELCQGKQIKETPQNSGVMQWFDALVGVTPVSDVVVASEQPLVSLRYQIAGTADIIYRDTTPPRGIVLGDLKTGGTIPTTAYLQLAAYKMMWEEMGNEPISRTEIIHCPVAKPGKSSVKSKPEIGIDKFLKVLELYRALEGERL